MLAPPNCSFGGESSSIDSSMVIGCIRGGLFLSRLLWILRVRSHRIVQLFSLRLECQLFQLGVEATKILINLVLEFERFPQRPKR